jgi:CRISPR/Cas system-associated exonuclease Cas4 (RecB family)
MDMPRQPTHLSASSIGTFIKCPRKYRLRYIDRAQEAFRSVALAFGSAFHETVAQWLTALAFGVRPSPGQMNELFAQALRKELRRDGPPVLFDDDEDEDDLRASGSGMLDAFQRQVRPPEELVGIEAPFELELVEPITGEVLPPLVGAVDAVVVMDGMIELWELKTAKKRWTSDALAYDLQATSYRVAMRKRHPEAEVVLFAVTKTKKPDVQIERLVRGPSDEDDLVATVAGVSRAVEAGVDHPIRSWQCKSCPYLGACR